MLAVSSLCSASVASVASVAGEPLLGIGERPLGDGGLQLDAVLEQPTDRRL